MPATYISVPLLKSLGPYGYGLYEPFLFDLYGKGEIACPPFTIPVSLPNGRYFISDLASLPSIVKVFSSRFDLGLVAPVVHDYLCEVRGQAYGLVGQPLRFSSEETHLLFYQIMLWDGIPAWKAWMCYKAVLWFGPKFPKPQS